MMFLVLSKTKQVYPVAWASDGMLVVQSPAHAKSVNNLSLKKLRLKVFKSS